MPINLTRLISVFNKKWNLWNIALFGPKSNSLFHMLHWPAQCIYRAFQERYWEWGSTNVFFEIELFEIHMKQRFRATFFRRKFCNYDAYYPLQFTTHCLRLDCRRKYEELWYLSLKSHSLSQFHPEMYFSISKIYNSSDMLNWDVNMRSERLILRVQQKMSADLWNIGHLLQFHILTFQRAKIQWVHERNEIWNAAIKDE